MVLMCTSNIQITADNEKKLVFERMFAHNFDFFSSKNLSKSSWHRSLLAKPPLQLCHISYCIATVRRFDRKMN